MGKHANFEVLRNNPDQPLIITDVGPWDVHFTVTNDAEWVVEWLVSHKYLSEGRKLLYYDSEGDLDEIVVKDGKFAGFKTGLPYEEKVKLWMTGE
jgi:hypothetical protein